MGFFPNFTYIMVQILIKIASNRPNVWRNLRFPMSASVMVMKQEKKTPKKLSLIESFGSIQFEDFLQVMYITGLRLVPNFIMDFCKLKSLRGQILNFGTNDT